MIGYAAATAGASLDMLALGGLAGPFGLLDAGSPTPAFTAAQWLAGLAGSKALHVESTDPARGPGARRRRHAARRQHHARGGARRRGRRRGLDLGPYAIAPPPGWRVRRERPAAELLRGRPDRLHRRDGALATRGTPTVLFTGIPTAGGRALCRTKGHRHRRDQPWPSARMDGRAPAAGLHVDEGFGRGTLRYKVCSTFDSSPATDIGRAIDIAAAIFGQACTPLVVGAPGIELPPPSAISTPGSGRTSSASTGIR